MTTVSSTSTATSTGTLASTKKLNETFDSFLLMLTTQLKNQDPLSPMDSAQFTNQLVMFSGVEQQINTNQKLEQLLGAQNASQAQAALGYIGLNAEVADDSLDFAGQPVELAYSLPEEARSTSISILDDMSNVVWSGIGETASGKHTFVWDGTTSDGANASSGSYRILVGASNTLGETMTASTYIPRLITGIETDGSSISLRSGDRLMALSDVAAVSIPNLYSSQSTTSTEE